MEEYPISDDERVHGTNGPVGSSFSNYQYPIIGEQPALRLNKAHTFAR